MDEDNDQADGGGDAGPLHRPSDGPPPRAELGEDLLDGARIIPNKNRELQVAPAPGRRLFDGEAKRVFLEWFAGTGNLCLAARKAGFHYRTVLRHRSEEEGFRADFDEALEQSKVRLRAWAMEAKDDGRTEYDPDAHAPAHLDSGQVLQLLRDDAQREAAALRAAAGGGRGGRPFKIVSMDEVRRQLVVRLRALGLKLSAEEAGEAASDADIGEG